MDRGVSQKDKEMIVSLSADGKTDSEIAEKIGWTNKTAARKVGKIRRELGLKKNGGKPPSKDLAAKAENLVVSMDQMTKEVRFKYVQEKFMSNPRTKFVLGVMGEEERHLFTEEYFTILKSTDSLTEAEEQQLFTAILEYVLGMRAMRIKTEEENLYRESMRGNIPRYLGEGKTQEENPQYRSRVDRRFEDEYNSRIKNYQSLMSELKMSRRSRLDKIKQDRKSLVDVAMELSSKDAQATAANEIERLSKMQDDELKRMLENDYIIGVFGE